MRFMAHFILTAGLLLLGTQPAWSIVEGEAFPSVRIAGVKSEALEQSKLQGKVTIINFWATWCEACKVELVEMQDEFGELLKNPKFQFAFVSLDKDPSKAIAWVKGHLQNPDQYIKYLHKDPSFAAADQIEVDAFPMTLVVDQTGKVVKVQKGFKEDGGSTKALASLAKKLLAH